MIKVMDTPFKVCVRISPDSSRTDGKTVWVATEVFDDTDLPIGNRIDTFLGLTIHEGCHLLYTDFSAYKGLTNRIVKFLENLLNAYIESVRWNFFTSLNLALVVPMTVLIMIMTAFFICWTRIVYRHVGRRFITWKTLGEVALSLFLLQVPAIVTCVYALLIY